MSQIINWTENDKLSYEWLKKEAIKRNDKKALKELEEVGVPPYTDCYKQWDVLRKYWMKYNTMIYSDKKIKHPGLFNEKCKCSSRSQRNKSSNHFYSRH